MNATTLLRAAADYSNRRAFLRRSSQTAALASAAVLGIHVSEASAYFTHGCGLCQEPTGGDCAGRRCSWCWWGSCHQNPGGSSWHRTHCCEAYYHASDNCNSPGCVGVDCSFFGTNIAC